MSDLSPTVEKSSSNQRFVSSLALAFFATGMLDVIASLFLRDIAMTFFGSTSRTAVGAASHIVLISTVAAVIFGSLSGILSVRVKHKTLLLVGALCITIGAVGCFLAPSFIFLEIFYPLDGVGTVIVGAMAFSLIGEFLPLEKRAKAIGWVVAAAILSSAIGFPVAGFIAGVSGWRSVLLLYILPVSVAALALAYISIPLASRKEQIKIEKGAYFSSLKAVFFNKSATACLFGSMLINAAGVWAFFAATFWRDQFSLSIQVVSVITLGVTLVFALGSLIGGRLINKVGRKRLVISTWLLRGLLIAAIVFMPDFWTALSMSFLATLVGGLAVTSGPSLSLEQAPKSRGTMMSIGGVFGSVGSALGVYAGGIAIGQFGYQILGLTFGTFGVASALVIFLFAKDPCRT
jgi:predicted MFS family arabinose efflux permease